MSKVFMLVAVMFLGACAGSAETSSEADSTAAPVVADTTAVVADSTTVAPVTEGEAAK